MIGVTSGESGRASSQTADGKVGSEKSTQFFARGQDGHAVGNDVPAYRTAADLSWIGGFETDFPAGQVADDTSSQVLAT